MEGKMMFMQAITPVHTGIGQSAGIIDLPVARERTTNWPYIPGSSLKGVFRDMCQSDGKCENNLLIDAFGPDTQSAADSAGALLFCDGHMLCMPVRSFKGSFAWVTCNAATRRLARDYESMEHKVDSLQSVVVSEYESGIVGTGSLLAYNDKVYLEDLDLNREESETADNIAGFIADRLLTKDEDKTDFKARFIVVDDDLFTALVETCTEVSARIKINDETKTVDTTALWYEESVPAESIFWTPVLAAPRKGMDSERLFTCIDTHGKMMQVGGHASVGKGIMRVTVDNGGY